jgi:archaemetzincin
MAASISSWLSVVARIVAIGLFFASARVSCNESADSPGDEIKRRVYASITSTEEKGFVRMQPPKPGDWLAVHHEAPQSFERYCMSRVIRPSAERRTIVLQPLGEMNAEQKRLLDDLRDYAEAFFQLPVRIEKSLELKSEADGKPLTRKVLMPLRRIGYDTQYNADELLKRVLIPSVPKDAVACLGVTMQDLYSGDGAYVFGVGNLKEGVGVYSLCRYFPEFWTEHRNAGAETRALRLACKVLNHETGHMFGLHHCVFFQCSMNGWNNLEEADEAPIDFCPVCHRKLQWNIAFDPGKRFAELAAFYARHAMKEEAEFVRERLARWRKAAEQEHAEVPRDE